MRGSAPSSRQCSLCAHDFFSAKACSGIHFFLRKPLFRAPQADVLKVFIIALNYFKKSLRF